ncbi:hypothetical protein OSTOST_05208 [Ostertagia ostertagi]
MELHLPHLMNHCHQGACAALQRNRNHPQLQSNPCQQRNPQENGHLNLPTVTVQKRIMIPPDKMERVRLFHRRRSTQLLATFPTALTSLQ